MQQLLCPQPAPSSSRALPTTRHTTTSSSSTWAAAAPQHRHSNSNSRPRHVAAAAAKKQKPKRRTRKGGQPVSQRISFEDAYAEDDYNGEPENAAAADSSSSSSPRRRADVVLLPTSSVPKAPPPTNRPADTARPEDLYPVFPQQQSPVTRLPGSSGSGSSSGGKWAWADDADGAASAAAQQPQQLWNPRTGFMRTRADVERANAAAAAAAAGNSSSSSRSAGGQGSRRGEERAAPAAAGTAPAGDSSQLVERLPPQASPFQPPPPPLQQLSGVSRGRVLASCAATSAAMVAGALGIRLFAAQQSAALFGGAQADIDRLLQLPPGLQDVQQAGVLVGAAAAVTAARLLLLQRWPEFAATTEASNKQVLGPLQGYPDAALIALLSGVSEELLFRGALVPATWPDARGVLAAGALFGALHVSGGRNLAYAAWASAVGWLYGAAFLATGNVWVPAGAHAAANFASAALWLSRQQGQGQGEKGGEQQQKQGEERQQGGEQQKQL